LLNVFLLYQVVQRLTSSWRAACFSAALWGMAPVDEGSIGWFAVYGHVLAGTCTLWVLAGLAKCRAGAPMRRSAPWLWGLATIIGATCFGVGIGVALVMPAVAWLLLPPGGQRTIAVAVFAGAAVAVVGLYLGQQWLYEALYNELAQGGSTDTTLGNDQIAFAAYLAGYGVVAVLFGALDRPPDYPGPVGYAVISGAALCIAFAVARAPRRTVQPLLACALLAAGVYGLIAAGRATLVAPENLAWMVRTTRYQYVGAMAVAVAVGVVTGALTSGWWAPDWLTNGVLAVWAIATVAVALRYGPPINHFNFARRETIATLAAIDALAAAAPPGADVYIPNRPFRSIGFLLGNDVTVFPGWAAIFAISHPDDVVDGHRLHFVMEDVGTLAKAQEGRRASALLCGPARTSDAGAPGER
jgi:hypothetical protein